MSHQKSEDGVKTPDDLWRELERMSLHDPLVKAAFHMMEENRMTREHMALYLAVACLEYKNKLLEMLLEASKKGTRVVLVKGDVR